MAIIVSALYGDKSAGADYWHHVRKAMLSMNFESCKYDLDLWFRPASKDDGTEYIQYLLLYTEDILCTMEDSSKFLLEEFV